jgi:hypothetical protein
MQSKLTLCLIVTISILFTSCRKNIITEVKGDDPQKESGLNVQHEIDLETLNKKGATALLQFVNAAALEQVRINDSLVSVSANNAKKQDYSVVVANLDSNVPVADADVTVSSQGKLYTVKTNAQGAATFTSLSLFPTSAFLVTKTGFAATQILNQNIVNGNVRIWSPSDLSNEVSGTLFIDTDLITPAPETVGANVLITASTPIQSKEAGAYTVHFPAYTTATGTYSIKVPTASGKYTMNFEQITTDQKLYVNSTENDVASTFPEALPGLKTVQTTFSINNYSARVPLVHQWYYYKFAPDKNGKIAYVSGYTEGAGYNNVFVMPINDKFELRQLYGSHFNNNLTVRLSVYQYEPKSQVNVEMIDITGAIIQTAPVLFAFTGYDGKFTYNANNDTGAGYIHLKRDAAGDVLPSSRGVLLKANLFDSINNAYNLSSSFAVNYTNNKTVSSQFIMSDKGEKKVLNYYYGTGERRALKVY